MPVLIYETGPHKGRAIRLEVDKIYSLGRDEAAELVVDDELASRVHARVRGKEGTYYIKDAGSSNGTLVNDHRIEGVIELSSGDKVTIGTTMLSFLSDEEAGGAAGRTLGGYKLLQRLGRGGMSGEMPRGRAGRSGRTGAAAASGGVAGAASGSGAGVAAAASGGDSLGWAASG